MYVTLGSSVAEGLRATSNIGTHDGWVPNERYGESKALNANLKAYASNLRNRTLKDKCLTGTGFSMLKTNKSDIFACPSMFAQTMCLFWQSVNLLLSYLYPRIQPVHLSSVLNVHFAVH